MSFSDQVQVYLASVIARITSKTLPNSISLQDESGCFNDLAALVQQLANNEVLDSASFNGENPIVVPWDENMQAAYGNGKLSWREYDGNNNLIERTDLNYTRVLDYTDPANPVQTGLSLDYPNYPTGQVVIEYSAVPINLTQTPTS